MNYTSLYGITAEGKGVVLQKYDNVWLFCPVLTEVLAVKYTFAQSPDLPWFIPESLETVEKRIVATKNWADKICWALRSEAVMYTAYAKETAKILRAFHKDNASWGEKVKKGKIKDFETFNPRVVSRFHQIADDLCCLDTEKYPYYVIKASSLNSSVEDWFDDDGFADITKKKHQSSYF